MNRQEEREKLERAATALRAGEIGEGEFLRLTREKWRGLAGYLHARWRRRLPAWVEADDIEQELRLLAIRHVGEWEPGRGTRIGAYVTWATIHRTQREMNRWRGARLHGNEGKNPGHFEVPFSAFRQEDENHSPVEERMPAHFDDPMARLEAGERFDEVLRGCVTVREAVVLLALRECGGNLPETAATIWEDFRARVECEVRDERHAVRVVVGVLGELSRRFAA